MPEHFELSLSLSDQISHGALVTIACLKKLPDDSSDRLETTSNFCIPGFQHVKVCRQVRLAESDAICQAVHAFETRAQPRQILAGDGTALIDADLLHGPVVLDLAVESTENIFFGVEILVHDCHPACPRHINL